ncbi:MAG: AAA family ATPase [Christensenellaceae bacterium]
MSIDKIYLKNFTVFRDADLRFAKGINIIIGENGTGKTHLLKLLYAFLDVECDATTNNSYTAVFARNILNFFCNNNSVSHMCHFQNDEKEDALTVSVSTPEKEWVFSAKNFKPDGYINDFFEATEKKKASAVFIPTKDMMTHAKGLPEMYASKRTPFDATLIHIINHAKSWELKEMPDFAKTILPKLESLMGGTVVLENEEFYIKKTDGTMVNFAVEAEGLKKIAVLWQLIMNESITKQTVLLWDEPEANINPIHIPVIVEALLELQRNGVQIFVSTHDYVLAKYFEIRKKPEDSILFHSLYQQNGSVCHESSEKFSTLANNPIMDAFNKLLDEVYTQTAEG